MKPAITDFQAHEIVDSLLNLLVDYFDPEDVFPDSELASWAIDHGYVLLVDKDV